jgi:hypothetical protein
MLAETFQQTILQSFFTNSCHQTPTLLVNFALSTQSDHILDEEISVNEIISCLSTLKIKKSPGHERVPLEFFKNCSNE